jgi:type VI secretion system secreted protein Hcp
LEGAANRHFAEGAGRSNMQNIFWEIDGIKGESTSAQGKDMIEVLSFSHGVAMPLAGSLADPGGRARRAPSASNTSRASGRCVHEDFTLTKRVDLSSPLLNLKCCGGEDIKTMKIHMWKADAAGSPVEYITYTFESCILTSVAVSGTEDQPVETVAFNYKKVTWDYAQQLQSQPGGKKGKNSSTWSLEENRAPS